MKQQHFEKKYNIFDTITLCIFGNESADFLSKSGTSNLQLNDNSFSFYIAKRFIKDTHLNFFLEGH